MSALIQLEMTLAELVDASMLEFSDDYAHLSPVQEPKWRVKTLLMKLESDRKIKARGDEPGIELMELCSKFAAQTEKIFSGLPKPKDFITFASHDLPLLFTPDEVQEFALKHRLNKSQTKAVNEMNKAALSKAVEWGLLEVHPLAKVKPSKVDHIGRVRFLDAREEQRLRAALDAREERHRQDRDHANSWREQRDYVLLPDLRAVPFVDHLKPLVLLSLNTGLRRGELFNLERQHVDLERALLTVAGDTEGNKTAKARHVPLNREARAVLWDWITARQPTGLLFPGRNGGRLDNISTAWERLRQAAKLDNFRWHDLRHTFASKLVMAGVDLNAVRELLGHASLDMTLRYAHLAPEHKAAAVARLDAPTIQDNVVRMFSNE